MRARALLAAALPLLAAACGGERQPTMPTNTKTVPTVEEQYQRRSLVTWRSLAGALPAEERAAQVWALSLLEKDPLQSLDILLRRLDDADPSVQLAAIVATGRLAPPSARAAEKLVAFFESSQEPLRRHARSAVGNLGAVAVEPLRQALGASSVRTRWHAACAFHGMGEAGAQAVPDLARLATEDENSAVRIQAQFALARMGPTGVQAAIGLLRAADSVGRAEVATALALGGAGVVGPMAELLGDEDQDLAARAAGVLVDLGPRARPALDALVRALERAGPVRFNAAEALLAIGAPAIERVKPLADSPDEGLAGIARYILDTWQER